jgi:hypothetical protein
VNWWIVMMLFGSLLGAIALFTASDEQSSGSGPEVTPREALLRFRSPHAD